MWDVFILYSYFAEMGQRLLRIMNCLGKVVVFEACDVQLTEGYCVDGEISQELLPAGTTFRNFPTTSNTRCATSHLVVSGTSTTSPCVRMVTALRSESKPTPSRETSFTTMASRNLEPNFFRAFSNTFCVSAAKPIMSCDFFTRASSARMSVVGSSSSDIGPVLLIFCSADFLGR